MRNFFLIFFCLVFSKFFSQEKRFDGWYITNSIGFSEYKQENSFKTSAFAYSFSFGKEVKLKKKTSLLVGLGGDSMYGDYVSGGNNYHFNSKFINIPLALRIYNSVETTSCLFAEVGIENKIKVDEKIENIALNTESKGQKGYHLGVAAGFGYRTKVQDQLDVLIGFNYRGDILQAGYDNGNKSKINNNINLSLTFNIYKKGE